MPSVVFQKPHRAIVMHYASHLTYLAIMIHFLQWSRYWNWYLGCTVFGVLLNAVLHYFFSEKDRRVLLFSPSALVICSSTFMFVTGESFLNYLVLVSMGILSKFLIRVNKQHVFNPSSVAIFTGCILGIGVFPLPLVLNVSPWWALVFLLLGIFTAVMADRMVMSATFVVAFIAIHFMFPVMGFPWAIFNVSSLLGYTMLIYTFHFITDPKTSPASHKQQIYFGLALALAMFVLRIVYLYGNVPLSLLLVCAIFAAFKSAPLLERLMPIGVLATSFCLGIFFGHLPKPFHDIFDESSYQARSEAPTNVSGLKYEEVSSKLGLELPTSWSELIFKQHGRGEIAALNTVVGPGISVRDFDGDGFPDILIAGRTRTALLKNVGGKSFTDVTDAFGIGQSAGPALYRAAFVDYDNDGRPDIVGINVERQFKLYHNEGNRFRDVSERIKLPQNSGLVFSIGFFDYNRDGYPDIIVTNHPWIRGLSPQGTSLQEAQRAHKKNHILTNHHGEYFTEATGPLELTKDEFSFVGGISDVNGDGWPDLYFANDFGRDRFFLNEGGKAFVDKSRQYMGNIRNRNGMSAEFGDIDGSGRLGTYVSNISVSLHKHGDNYFWENQGGTKFSNEATRYNIDRCGYSWGSKFFDADLDGRNDLYVASGMFGGKKMLWPYYSIRDMQPDILKPYMGTKEFFPRDGGWGGNLRGCLFVRTDDSFKDVAENVGLDMPIDSQTMVLIDMDNSGTQSIITASDRRLFFFKPSYTAKNNWIGIKLTGVKSNRDALGARVSVSSPYPLTKEFYFNNSMSSQTDNRAVFGLGKSTEPVTIKIRWPSGIIQEVSGLAINRYHSIVEQDPGKNQVALTQ